MFIIRTIIFTIIICILVNQLSKRLFKQEELDNALNTTIAGILFFIVFVVLPYFVPTSYDYQYSQRIVAMQDNQTYIISRHHVSSSINYYYMIEYNGGYMSQTAPQNQSIIYTTNGEPHMKYYKQKYDHQIARLLWGEYREDYPSWKYEFYIPEGSIKQDFNIDLK